jgi:wyosine [tRNA(Phe)-imidazoG37] synthetase (radical SAM superfamily)
VTERQQRSEEVTPLPNVIIPLKGEVSNRSWFSMNRPVILYGAGSRAEMILHNGSLPDNCTPVCFADKDVSKHGKSICGLSVMSLESARNKYPDSEIFVTLGEPNKKQFFHEIQQTNQGLIPKIIDFRAVMRKRSCPFQNCLFINVSGFGFCCENFGKYNVPQVEYDCDSETSIIENFDRFLVLRERMHNGLLPPECADCIYASEGAEYLEKANELEHVFFDDIEGRAICNCKCIYCNYHDRKKSTDTLRKLVKVTRLILDEYSVIKPSVTQFNYYVGEITVDRARKEFYELCQEFYTLFATNGIVYDGFMKKQLEGMGCVHVSIDAGTRETYRAVKQVDAFDRLVANLNRYSSQKFRNIQLKYIFLPGMNDNLNDIDGFIEICKQCSLEYIVLSYETYKATYGDYDNLVMVEAVRHMIGRIRENGFHFYPQHGILERLCNAYHLI